MKKLAIFYFSLPAVTAVFLAACNAGNDVQVPRLYDRTPSGIVSFMGSVIESGHIISGQHCGDGDNIDLVYEREVGRLFDLTGSKPALIGADYGWKPDNDFAVINRRLIDHWDEGGLVTISWHADNPFSDSDRYNPRINTVAGKGSIDFSLLLSSYKPVPELKDYAVLSELGKPFVMSEIGPDRETYGKFDQMLLVEYLSGKAAYFLQWHSWTGAKVSIVDNLNNVELMNDPRVINLGNL